MFEDVIWILSSFQIIIHFIKNWQVSILSDSVFLFQ